MSNAFSSQPKETIQLSEKFLDSAYQHLYQEDIVEFCLGIHGDRYNPEKIVEFCEDNYLHVEDKNSILELRAISDFLFLELYKIIRDEARDKDHGDVVITDREDYRLEGYDHDEFEEMTTSSVTLYNLTDRKIVINGEVWTLPVCRHGYGDDVEIRELFSTEEELEAHYERRRLDSWVSDSFAFDALPKANKGRCLMVSPEVAMQGVEENRPDLVAPMRSRVKLVNLTDWPVKVTAYNEAQWFMLFAESGRITGEFDPEPGEHPYLVRPLRNPENIENYGFNAIAHLPPERENRLLMVSWPIALVGHAMGRTDLIGVPAPAL